MRNQVLEDEKEARDTAYIVATLMLGGIAGSILTGIGIASFVIWIGWS